MGWISELEGFELPALEAGCFQAHFRRTWGWGGVGQTFVVGVWSDRFPALRAEANVVKYGCSNM